MANRTISALPTSLDHTTIDDADLLAVDDTSEAETKKITVAEHRTAIRDALGATELAVIAAAAPGASVGFSGNQLAGARSLNNFLSDPAGEPADLSGGPYYLHLDVAGDGSGNVEDVIVVARSGGVRTIASPLQYTYSAGVSTVAYAGPATSPAAAGLQPAVDKVKLDAIESGADVTDAANVAAAGALMANGSVVATATLDLDGNQLANRAIATRTVTADATLTAADGVVLVDTSAGPVTLTAPDPALLCEPITVKKITSDFNEIFLATPSGLIDGTASPKELPGSTSPIRPSWRIATDGTDTHTLHSGGMSQFEKLAAKVVEIVEDFSALIGTTTSVITFFSSGTGAGVGGASADGNAVGKVFTNTGTTAAGYVYLRSSETIFRRDTGNIRLLNRLSIRQLATGVDDFTLAVGTGSLSSASPGDGIWFQYQGSAVANWKCVCQYGGVPTTVDSGVAVVAGSYLDLDIRSYAAAVEFRINGTLVATITTNIPFSTAAYLLIPGATQKTAGTSNTYVDFDYTAMQVALSAAR